MKVFFLTNISVNYYTLIRHTLLQILFVLLAVSATAGEITTLKQSVEYALGHNRLLAADASSVDQVHAQVDAAAGRLLPSLDVSTGISRTDAPGDYFGIKLNQQKITAADFTPARLNNPGYINNYRTRIGLTMPIYQGGALWAGKQQAVHHADSSSFNHAFMQQQVIYQTTTAYVRVRQSGAQIRAVESAMAAAKKRHQDTQAMRERGLLIDSDVMDAHVHLLRTTVQLQQARNVYARSRDELQRVMGIDQQTELNADEEVHLNGSQPVLQEAIESALSVRPDLKALEESYQAARAVIDQSDAAFRPRVDLVAAQEWNASTPGLRNPNTMIGATVSMNIFAGGSDLAKRRAATAKLVSLEMKISDHKHQIRNEVGQALRMLGETRLRHQSESEALKQSEESLRIKSLRYKQGLATTTDLLDAQLQVDNSRLASIRAKYDVTIAKAGLLLAVGTLNEESIR
jgi:outer membrane protein TolC